MTAFYSGALYKRIFGHCLIKELSFKTVERREGLIAAEESRSLAKGFPLGGMQTDSPPADLHLSFIRPPVREISILSVPGSQTSSMTSFLKIHSLSLHWGRKMQHLPFQRAPQRLIMTWSNSSPLGPSSL